MSYIINNTDPFISIKLTQLGRERLAKGALDFSYWALGDSEINYEREEVVDNNLTDVTLSAITRVMRPFDRQPDIKTFITRGTDDPLNEITSSNFKTVKAVINNEADERGFFSGNTGHTSFETYTADTYIQSYGTVANTSISGASTLEIGTAATRDIDDYILIKMTNDTVGSLSGLSNTTPVPNLWYKIQASTGTSITLDRPLPNLSTSTGTSSTFIVYKGGEVYNGLATGTTTSYWNTGTLAFNSCCDVTCTDVPFWNMNNIWCEDLAGTTGTTYEGFEYYGSYQYLGAKYPYYEYKCSTTASTADLACEGNGISVLDINKSISLLHYTNNTVSNVYGEYFYIDNDNDKTVKIHYPTLMYHRRTGSTGSGTTQGMSFVASGSVQNVGTSDIEYVDLIEDPTLVSDTARVVGRVYPQLKSVTFHDDEIVAATSYKTNRNWTLPPLACSLEAPSGGTSTGILAPNETMYVTYTLDNLDITGTTTGLTTSLPCQKYVKITNTTSSYKDVTFRMDNVDLLPYMRKIEDVGYDGMGFHAYSFKVLYQIVSTASDRPDPTTWKVYDYTTTTLTTTASETISPTALESQSPVTNGFVITTLVDTGTTTFDITLPLDMAPITIPTDLQFGDERFFYGNIEAYIGATIYKTLFPITINSGEFNATTNPTRSTNPSTNPPDITISEVGIYDSNQNLVIIGKLSKPTKLIVGNTVMIELSMDF